MSSPSSGSGRNALHASVPGTSCPVCSDGNSRFFAESTDRLFGIAPGSYDLYRCSSCRCIFQSPIPGAETLGRFYPDAYWWDGNQRAASAIGRIFTQLEKTYRESVTLDHVRFLELCARRVSGSGKRLLDVGCGSGTFLHLSRRRGFEVHGLDASSQAVSIAQRQYGLDVRQGSLTGDAWEGHRFDFITMFHVLEHLPDPRSALHFAIEHLTAGGSLIIQVPNADSFQARFFGARWYGFDVPRHVINFTRSGLQYLLDEAGLRGSVLSRFSLRDNPASLASSVVPALDPIGRKGRRLKSGTVFAAAAELTYFAFFLAALPIAALESALGSGGTLWVHSRLRGA